MSVDRPHTKAGPYRLEELLGHGGMGVVYRAVGPDGEAAAVKMLQSGPMRMRADVARFEREARIRIEHPNVVRVLDAGVEEAIPWIAFELLVGESLSDRMRRGPVELREAVDVAWQITCGLEAAHRAQIVHRDLKPSNVFLCEGGTTKIIDFGIARMQLSETQLTATGSVLGTPTYLSPEQAQGQQALDARTDLWSLGVVLHEMIAGRPPFDRGSALATMLAVMIEPAPPLSLVVPAVPTDLSVLVGRCLEKHPDDRFPDASSLREALEAVETPVGHGASPVGVSVSADTSPALPAQSASITPGEDRVVAVLLAQRVLDHAALRNAVTGGGGRLLSIVGDRAIGLFGGETWEGDEVQRAAGAALSARSAARFVAIASGRASYSGATGIAGSALSEAERGCMAQLSGVAVDAASARVLGTTHELRAVDGELFELVERSSGVTHSFAPPAARAHTIGREAELAQMHASFAAVRDDGRLAMILVGGPPGIGKSHLRWEMGRILEEQEAETPFRILSARAEPGQRQRSFSLWEAAIRARAQLGAERWGWPSLVKGSEPLEQQRAVRALVQDAMPPGPEAEECAVFFCEMLGVPTDGQRAKITAARRDPQLMRDRLRLALEDWLVAACARGPVAVLFEDLQWADEASMSLLEELGELLEDAPLLIFVTARSELLEARPELLAAGGTMRINPRGLTSAQVGKMAESILGNPLPKETVDALHDRTAGNPLFVEQIVSASKEGDELGELPLPLTVEAAVQSRLDHLPAKEKDLCKRASVFERSFTSADLEALGVFEPRPLLSSLTRREILASRMRSRGGGGREHRFRSSIIRDVAYRLIAPALREDLHLRVASRLAGLDAEPEETALHFEYAARKADAAGWYVRAAKAAARRGDAPSVIRCAGKALDLGPPDETRFALHMMRSDAFEVLGRLDEQRFELEQALVDAALPAERARALTDRAVLTFRRGDAEAAREAMVEAVAVARGAADDHALATARGRQAALLTYAGRLDEAGEALAEARQLAGPDNPALGALLATWRAQLAGARGDLGERRSAYRDAFEQYEAAGDVRRAAGAELNLADAYNRVAAWSEAERALRDALDKCRRLGIRIMEGYCLVNLGYCLPMLARRDEALAALDECARIAADVGETRLSVVAHVYRARALLSDDAPRAREEAARAVEAATALGADALRALALAVLSRAALAAGDAAGALAASTDAMELLERLGHLEEDEAEVFVAHVDALAAAGRDSAAVRERGLARVRELAAKIADPEWRRRFERDVPAHRALAG